MGNYTLQVIIILSAFVGITVIIQVIWMKKSWISSKNTSSQLSGLDFRDNITAPYNSSWNDWIGVGICRKGVSYIPDISNDVCLKTDCLTNIHGKSVNFKSLLGKSLNTSSSISWNEENKNCRRLKASVTSIHHPDLISIIYTARSNPKMLITGMLEVLSTTAGYFPIEIVFVNDGGRKDMNIVAEFLENLKSQLNIPVIIIQHTKKRDNIYSNNAALRAAHGKYAVFMSNDVYVLPGWLHMLMRTMTTYPGNLGIVGPLMISENGNINEAGGALFQGAIPHNMARGLSPTKQSQYQARVVDYISAACILIRRDLFLQYNLFGNKYSPAYYEDTDAAVTLAKKGWLTVFQPLSAVIRFEGQSDGVSGNSSEKVKYMASSLEKFRGSHMTYLSKYCPRPDEIQNGQSNVHMALSFLRQQNNILILEDIIPEPDRDAGSIRLYELLHILRDMGYSVSIEPVAGGPRCVRYVLPLLADGINVQMSGTVKSLADQIILPFYSKIRPFVELCPWKLIIIARRDVFLRHIENVKAICPNTPIIYDTVDVHFIREYRMLNLTKSQAMTGTQAERDAFEAKWKETERAADIEMNHMRTANVTYVVSIREKEILEEKLGKVDVRILSNIYNVDSSKGHQVAINQRSGAIFVGNMCHGPNVDAVEVIMKEVLQKDNELPSDFKMHFVWSRSRVCKHPIYEIAEKHPRVVIHLDASDAELLDLHHKVRVVLAPLRFGAGVKGKVNYGLLHSVPVIATRIAAEGMGLVHEESIYLAETGEEIRNAINRLYSDDKLYTKLQKGGVDIMRKLFGRDVARQILEKTFKDLGVTVDKKKFECPHLTVFESFNKSVWPSYWFGESNAGFPLYPNLPYESPVLLSHYEHGVPT